MLRAVEKFKETNDNAARNYHTHEKFNAELRRGWIHNSCFLCDKLDI